MLTRQMQEERNRRIDEINFGPWGLYRFISKIDEIISRHMGSFYEDGDLSDDQESAMFEDLFMGAAELVESGDAWLRFSEVMPDTNNAICLDTDGSMFFSEGFIGSPEKDGSILTITGNTVRSAKWWMPLPALPKEVRQ